MATTTSHPGNDYYVYTLSGTIQRQSNPILAAGLKASGWAGPYTWAQAQTALSQGETAHQAVTGAANGTIDDLINFIKQGSIWTRVAEFAVGGILLYVGLKALATPAGQQPVKQTAKSTVANVAKWVK